MPHCDTREPCTRLAHEHPESRTLNVMLEVRQPGAQPSMAEQYFRGKSTGARRAVSCAEFVACWCCCCVLVLVLMGPHGSSGSSCFSHALLLLAVGCEMCRAACLNTSF